MKKLMLVLIAVCFTAVSMPSTSEASQPGKSKRGIASEKKKKTAKTKKVKKVEEVKK